MADTEEKPAAEQDVKPKYQSAQQMFARARSGENIPLDVFGRNVAGYNYQRAERTNGTVDETKLLDNAYSDTRRASNKLPAEQRAEIQSSLAAVRPTREQRREARADAKEGGGVTTQELLNGTDGDPAPDHAALAKPFDRNGNGQIDRCDLPAPKPGDKKDIALFVKLCGEAGITPQASGNLNGQEHPRGDPPTGNRVGGTAPSPEQAAAAAR